MSWVNAVHIKVPRVAFEVEWIQFVFQSLFLCSILIKKHTNKQNKRTLKREFESTNLWGSWFKPISREINDMLLHTWGSGACACIYKCTWGRCGGVSTVAPPPLSLQTMSQDSWAGRGKWWIRPQIYWLPPVWGSGFGVKRGGVGVGCVTGRRGRWMGVQR